MRINLKNKKHQLMLGLFIVSLLIISSVIALSISDSQQDVPQLTETIGRGDIERNVMATGSLKPSLQVNVGAQVNGQLTKLYVKQGDRVTRGQLLAEIDPTLQQNDYVNRKLNYRARRRRSRPVRLCYASICSSSAANRSWQETVLA